MLKERGHKYKCVRFRLNPKHSFSVSLECILLRKTSAEMPRLYLLTVKFNVSYFVSPVFLLT